MTDCPICRQHAPARELNRSFPFCSARCKSIDLGKWLSEEYRVPVKPESAESFDAVDEASLPSMPLGDRDDHIRHLN